ncbi:MAG: hypothetical protein Q4D07_06235 [Selenomonadaceae bacterium]|nr:hypothetical protein [Selenomonadaceae bacterium]
MNTPNGKTPSTSNMTFDIPYIPSDNNNYDDLIKSADTVALYNTIILFIAALEFTARGKESEAAAAANRLNSPMASLIRAIIENDTSLLTNHSEKPLFAKAWCTLAEPVANRTSEKAAMKFAALAPIVDNHSALSTAADYFFNFKRWRPAAHIFNVLTADMTLSTADYLRKLGICRYSIKDYSGAAAAFIAAADKGDTSQETLSYITWLEEKYTDTEANENE